MIGLYSDFGTDWAYPSIRTIASQAGLSRQTVLVAIEQLTQMGLLATNKAKGTIDRVPDHPPGTPAAGTLWRPSSKQADKRPKTGLISLEDCLADRSNFFRR